MTILELAHRQLTKEIESGKRETKMIKVGEKIYPYSFVDLMDYAKKISKGLSRKQRLELFNV